jgi:hypothetical protein
MVTPIATLEPIPAGMPHWTEVAAIHTVDLQGSDPNLAEGLKFTLPKLKPESVTEAEEVRGELDAVEEVITGLSYFMLVALVPLMPLTIPSSLREDSVPQPAFRPETPQSTVVSVTHELVPHLVLPTSTVWLRSFVPKFLPWIVTDRAVPPPLVGRLAVSAWRTGASNENLSDMRLLLPRRR